MRRSIVFAAFAVAALAGAACNSRVGDLTFVSTKNLERPYEIVERNVSARDCAHLILFVPLGSLDLSLQEATDQAIRRSPKGDMLVNASVSREFLYLLAYNRSCIRVRGDVAQSRSPAMAKREVGIAPPPKLPPPTPPKSLGVLEKVQ